MRQVLLGVLGVLAAGAAHAETYSFSSVMAEAWVEQTLINCTGSKTNSGERVPQGCTLRERAIAYPNHEGRYSSPVACAAGHPIVFHPSGTLAECTLDAEQPALTMFTHRVLLGGVRALCASTRAVARIVEWGISFNRRRRLRVVDTLSPTVCPFHKRPFCEIWWVYCADAD